MAKGDGIKYVKKAYTVLSLAVVAVIWVCFFGSLFFGRLSHGPVEETWFGEVMKWVVMTPILVVLVDCIAYALVMTNALRKEHDIDRPFWEELKEFVQGKLGKLSKETPAEEVTPVEEVPAEEPILVETAEEVVAPVKRTRKKKVAAEE